MLVLIEALGKLLLDCDRFVFDRQEDILMSPGSARCSLILLEITEASVFTRTTTWNCPLFDSTQYPCQHNYRSEQASCFDLFKRPFDMDIIEEVNHSSEPLETDCQANLDIKSESIAVPSTESSRIHTVRHQYECDFLQT